MASSLAVLGMASIGASVDAVLKIMCCAGFALIIVMLFNFVLARYKSRVAKTEVSEILESSMNYYTHSEPYATLEPYGMSYEGINQKKKY